MGKRLAVVLKVPNGFGWMPSSEYESLPEPVREAVEVIAACPSEERARWLLGFLPNDWRDDVVVGWSEGDRKARAIVIESEGERVGDVISDALFLEELERKGAEEWLREQRRVLELWPLLTEEQKRAVIAHTRMLMALHRFGGGCVNETR
jgi:hypothetical protein